MMASNVNVISEEVIKTSVTKDSTERLKDEMKVAQNFFDLSQIEVMSRDKLISYVTHLRGMCNQTESVKVLVKEFDPKVVKMLVSSKMFTETKEVEQKGSAVAQQVSGDMSAMFIALMQSMNKRDDEARKREDEFRIMMVQKEEEKRKREDEIRRITEQKEDEIRRITEQKRMISEE